MIGRAMKLISLPAWPAPLNVAMPLAMVLSLAACGSSSEPEPAPVQVPTSTVPALAEGAYQAYASGDTLPGASIYLNKDGKGFVLLSADGDGAASVLHVVDKTRGRRVPAIAGNVTLGYERSQPLTLSALSGATAAGSYQAMVGGKPASFTVAADGSISAGASDCKLSGKLDFSAGYGGAVGLSLTASGCGDAATGSYQGIALASSQNAPAALQLVGENGSKVLDLLAYR